MARTDAQITKDWEDKLEARLELRRAALMRMRIAADRLEEARENDVHPRQHLVDDLEKEQTTYAVRKQQVDEARRVLERHEPESLQEAAYDEARALVGIMEAGGNNRGRAVERIIKEGGGLPGQAWCGWFMACVYRRAGSQSVSWHWGAVRLMHTLAPAVTTKPVRGDIVRFTFDHTGMFVKDNGDGSITTIEGNTGASGAVSDSKGGGDGVYIKRRAKSLVKDYLRVPA